MMSPVISGSGGCAKCGIIKISGKLSCCARGGAWFKKCGNVGEKRFDHTWTEGTHACKVLSDLAGDKWDKFALEVALQQVKGASSALSTTRIRNATQSEMNRHFSVFKARITSSKECVVLAKTVVSLFFSIFTVLYFSRVD